MNSTSRVVYLVAHNWHTGFVLSAEDVYPLLPQLRKRFGEMQFFEFGWGDRRYYQSESSALSEKLLAVLVPSGSTMLVLGLAEKPVRTADSDQIIELTLENEGYQSLLKFINNSFYKNRQNCIEEQKSGRFDNSHFYRGAGLYHLFNTCNKWTAKGLKEAGIELSPTFKLSAASVMDVAANCPQAAGNSLLLNSLTDEDQSKDK